jgi:hypothetical protein
MGKNWVQGQVCGGGSYNILSMKLANFILYYRRKEKKNQESGRKFDSYSK